MTLRTLPVIAVCLFLVACSNVRAIGTAAGNVNDHAAAIEALCIEGMTEAAKPNPDMGKVVHAFSQSKSHASSIRAEVNTITTNLGGTTDEHSPWASTLKWVAIALAFGVVAFVLWRCGLDRLCAIVISWLPMRTKAKAIAAVDAGDLAEAEREDQEHWEKHPSPWGVRPAPPEALARKREQIAVRRAKSKHYDEAFKAARKQQERNVKG